MSETPSQRATREAKEERARRGELQINPNMREAHKIYTSRPHGHSPAALDAWNDALNVIEGHVYCTCSVEQILTLAPCPQRDTTPIRFNEIYD